MVHLHIYTYTYQMKCFVVRYVILIEVFFSQNLASIPIPDIPMT